MAFGEPCIPVQYHPAVTEHLIPFLDLGRSVTAGSLFSAHGLKNNVHEDRNESVFWRTEEIQ